MDFNKLNVKRKQTDVFSDKLPSINLIEEILHDIHNYCPSKQNVVLYQVRVLSMANTELRDAIFDPITTVIESDGFKYFNPQVLAPYLFVFSPRLHINTDYNKEYQDINSQHRRYFTYLEVGMASYVASQSAISKGLDYGFCGCIQQEVEHKLLLKKFNLCNDAKFYDYPILFMGIGYGAKNQLIFRHRSFGNDIGYRVDEHAYRKISNERMKEEIYIEEMIMKKKSKFKYKPLVNLLLKKPKFEEYLSIIR